MSWGRQYEYRMPVRRNMDADLQRLRRAVLSSGSLEDAMRYYWARRRVEGPREHQDYEAFRLDLPGRVVGAVEIMPQGNAIRVLSPGPGHDPEPVLVNRVNHRVSGSYHYYPALGWVPVRESQAEAVLRGPFGRQRDPEELASYDPTHPWMNAMDLSRVGMGGARATQSAFTRFMSALHPTLMEWIDAHPAEMARGARTSANNVIWSAQAAADKARAKLDEAEREIGAAMLAELQAGG